MRLDHNQLSALAAVLRHGSFEAAAQALHVTPSAISQRIKALEEQVGGSVVQRGSPCRGTELGLRLAKYAEDIDLLEADLRREIGLDTDVSPGSTAPRVRIAVNADSLATWFVPAMAAVKGFLFDLVVDDQDHSADWLKRGEVSAAVTALERPVAGCDMIRLGALEYEATASPNFIDRWFRDGVTAETISHAPCMVFNNKDLLQKRWIASQFGSAVQPPVHFMPSTQAFVDGAVAGLGWGMNPVLLTDDHMARGTLAPLVPQSRISTPLTWQVSRILAPALSELTQSVTRSARRHLAQDCP